MGKVDRNSVNKFSEEKARSENCEPLCVTPHSVSGMLCLDLPI